MNVTKSVIVKLGSWVKGKVQSQDHYSKSVNFSFNGHDSFETLFGGLVSVTIKLGALVIAILLTISIFQRDNTSTSVNKVIKDITVFDVAQFPPLSSPPCKLGKILVVDYFIEQSFI